MGIFSGLSKFGLGDLENTSVIEKKTASTDEKKSEVVVKKEEDYIIDRHFTCPVCGMDFIARSVKSYGIRSIGKDTDLRPLYEGIDPLKYDAVCCEHCGYSAILKNFKAVSTKMSKEIKERISSKFNGIDNRVPVYSYDDAILRHKLALICDITKRAKNSDRAYTCLKLAWVIRGKRLTLNPKNPEELEEIKSLYKDEMECITNAFEGFELAYSNESFPIAGMDELTLKYLLSDLARKLKKYDKALRYVGEIITKQGIAHRIKDEALREKELIKQDMKKAGMS